MRRSKSNPAKYARNYRKISQRHMTGHDGGGEERLDETREKCRLESILQKSERAWRQGLVENEGGANKEEDSENDRKDATPSSAHEEKNAHRKEEGEDMLSLLSPELREQFSGMRGDALLILPRKKKSKPKQRAPPPLTPTEIKAAKSLYKNTQRKLTQLEQRRRQKEARAGLYRQLEENTLLKPAKNSDKEVNGNTKEKATPNNHAISSMEAQGLLLKSSERGKKVTKKERLKQLRRKEALGIKLTKEEMDILYVRYEAPPEESFPGTTSEETKPGNGDGGDRDKVAGSGTEERGNEEVARSDGKKQKTKKKKKKRPKEERNNHGSDDGQSNETQQTTKKARLEDTLINNNPSAPPAAEADVKEKPNIADAERDMQSKKNSAEKEKQDTTKPKQSYSQMMFASLTSLKNKTDTRNEELANEQSKRLREEEEKAAKLEEEERKRRKSYVPTEIGEITTMHHMLESDDDDDDDANETAKADDNKGTEKKLRNDTIVQRVNRPASIEESRYDLPVSAMEYEIVDAVRGSRDCTILCGETGSGKSTQVPQFLYEAGFSTRGWWRRLLGKGSDGTSGTTVGSSDNDKGDGDDVQAEYDHLLIGITQPRRVAAVSTAKRVSHEMGFGNGRSIPPNNLVAYQTRYETAGLGPSGGSSRKSKTRVKFMTDGILLQEIQSDLLLRKYGAIIIDEAHERNLNTDVLLGLLSVALPLRRKAAAESEGKLPPLKLVIMSATLRVEDFTENERLFPEGEGGSRPALVRVPGRTHPVSIHHSKVTELDDYEKVAMEKTCKIHRKLPPGGILVFLTGKQEIVRCINRLKQKLELGRGKKRIIDGKKQSFEGRDVTQNASDGGDYALNDSGYLRDMDDDEVDGDLFQKTEGGEDDFDDLENGEDMEINVGAAEEDDDKRPKKVRILPLYSMLSTEEQAKVFAPVPEDTRLIVVATNIAETSITIPGISYVVDSGRQKCRNYHASTGVASYDVMWISKAAADQRAGRAGRTGPGHCYRLYSSSVYSRHLDKFALPEVLTRPLEDVVLAMKAMNVLDVTRFPFPTPPGRPQVDAAVRLLANLGCVDVSHTEEMGGDGEITVLGAAVAKLPLGVRYGKMLLVAAQAGVLDYAIAMVAALSESSMFVHNNTGGNGKIGSESESNQGEMVGLDEVDQNQIQQNEEKRKRENKMKSKWHHDGGDILAAVKAVGAHAYAGRGAGGESEKFACLRFCEENGLDHVVMQRIAKMRLHLCKLARARLPNAVAAAGNSVAATEGKYLLSMPPPKRTQELLLRQAIASGLLDNIARRAPPGTTVSPAEFSGVPRSAYICANSWLKEALFIDNNSAVHSARPEWVCFDSIVRKPRKDGTTAATMQRVTPVDPEWLASVCVGSNLLNLGSSPLATPLPRYVKEEDSMMCAVETKFGGHGWEIPARYVDMRGVVRKKGNCESSAATGMRDDPFRWFARYLLEGKVLPELTSLLETLNDEPSIITRQSHPTKKVMLFVSALSRADVDSAAALRKRWAEKDEKFLFRELKPWVRRDCAEEAKRLWMKVVASNVDEWKNCS